MNTENSQPKISIILPTYNGARTVARAIESVIGQTFSSWELLVIDDGSTDGTAEVVKKYTESDARIRYLRNEVNLGIQKTLNRGIAESKGDYIARIDDDDAWAEPAKLALQAAYLDEHPHCVLVGTGTISVDKNGREITRYLSPESDASVRGHMLFRNCFVHSSVMFRKDAVMQAGGYSEDTSVRHVEDYDLWLRLGGLGDLANLPIYGVKFTVSSGSISAKNMLDQYAKNIALIKEYRHDYPRYHAGLAVARLRYAAALAFGKILPSGVRGRIVGLYKRLFK